MILRRSRLGFDAKDGGRETRARWRGTYIFFSFRYGAAERSTPPIDDFFPSPSVYVVAEPTLLLKALETPMTQKKIKNKVPLAREGKVFPIFRSGSNILARSRMWLQGARARAKPRKRDRRITGIWVKSELVVQLWCRA